MSTAAVAASPSILCLPASLVGDHRGFTPDMREVTGHLRAGGPHAWRPRAEVEQDESWVQVIPYCVLRATDRPGIFAYPRAGSEGRLHGRWSLGIGGHVERSDLAGGCGLNPWSAILRALNRELAEEVGLNPWSWIELRQLGLVRDTANAVGRVHLGIAFECWVERPRVRPEGETAGGRWLTPGDVRDHEGQLESWSRLIFRACYLPRGL